MPISVSGTTITFNDATTQTTAGRPGTVTSVATGNGLQGGAITTSGTLSVACPTFNTVGSYVLGCMNGNPNSATSGTNYGVGSGANQMSSGAVGRTNCGYVGISQNNLSGTWKWMGATGTLSEITSVACRVS
jgi:hypothetical protein